MAAAHSTGVLVFIGDQGASYPTSNIVLKNMTISSQDDVSGWTQAQWVANARSGFSAQSSAGGNNTKCISMTGSHITNVRVGAGLSANLTVFSGNEIDHFGDDGVDLRLRADLASPRTTSTTTSPSATAIILTPCRAKSACRCPASPSNNYSQILIDSNTVIRQTDPSLPFPTIGLQGIDAFDSDWTYLTVTNNIVVTSACAGISFSSVHGGLIANNTAVNDRLFRILPFARPRISVGDKTHQGSSSNGVAVRNNLANQMTVYNLDPGVTADHNVGMATAGPVFVWYVNRVGTYYGSPGTYGNANIIAAGGPAAEFVDFDPSTLTYNLKLKAGAPATKAGVARRAGRRYPRGNPRLSLHRWSLLLPELTGGASIASFRHPAAIIGRGHSGRRRGRPASGPLGARVEPAR